MRINKYDVWDTSSVYNLQYSYKKESEKDKKARLEKEANAQETKETTTSFRPRTS